MRWCKQRGGAVRWALWTLLGGIGIALAQGVYNYFPPPGISYTQSGGMALGSPTGGLEGIGTLNMQGCYVNGVACSTAASGGTVTSVSVVSANGFAGTVATPTTTPAISLSTTITGILYGNGTSLVAAVASDFPTLNQSTTGNAATATTAGAFTSSPTLCASGETAQGILANGDATGCITPYSVVNEAANTGFWGPPSGTAALPSFRAMVAADLPLSSSPIWTGNQTFTPSSGVAIAITGVASSDALDVTNGASGFTKVIGSSTTGESNGLAIVAGTNSSDSALEVTNRAGSQTLFSIGGDGTVSIPGTADLDGATNFASSGSATLAGTNTLSGATTVSGTLTLSGTTIASPAQAANGIGYTGVPPDTSCASGCTLAAAQRSQSVWVSSGTVIAPENVFSQGDTITIVAFGGSISIEPGSGVTMYWANGSTSSTGTRILSNVGIATLLYESATVVLITGSGIS